MRTMRTMRTMAGDVAEVDGDAHRNHGVARMLDRPACEMVASGSTQPHAPDYPNHTTGTDLDFLRNKPLEATIEAVPPAVANNALGRRSNRFGYEIEATRHERDEKCPRSARAICSP
jgi:hypothetical protein